MHQLSRPAPDASGAHLASYQSLHEVARMLLGSATIDEMLVLLTRELKRLVPYDVLTIYEIDRVSRMFVPLHAVDRYEGHLEDTPFPLEAGMTGDAVRLGMPVHYPRADLVEIGELVPGTEDEAESLAIVPLLVRQEPIGSINVSRLGEDVAFSDHEFDLICRLADLVALALDNTRTRERLTKEAQTDWLTGLSNHRAFQERLRDELGRAHRYRRGLSLILFDLDDFKLLNDVHGHVEGDVVLRQAAAAAGDGLRLGDTAYRIGGEEFAILLPESGKRAARAAAERLCDRVRSMPGIRPVTVSCGVATFPGDAGSPTELVAAADAALYAAKERGKDRVASYSAAVRAARVARISAPDRLHERESLAQLRLLGTLAGRLNRLNDMTQIAATIVEELRGMVDYHTARVHLLGDDGVTLEAVACGGAPGEFEDMTHDALRCRMGEGITGTAAERGQTLNIGDAQNCPFAEDVEGTEDVAESILAVPLRFERRSVGVIVLSKLGIDQFPVLSVRLLELLAAQAAVAFENARLLEAERRSAELARALLEIATRATASSVRAVSEDVVRMALRLTEATGAALVACEPEGGRVEVLAACGGTIVRQVALAAGHAGHPRGEGVAVVRCGELSALRLATEETPSTTAIMPVHGGMMVVVADAFTARSLDALAAVANQATLALRNAERVADRTSAATASIA